MYRITGNASSEFVDRMIPAPQGFLAPLASVININATEPATANLVKEPTRKIKYSEATKRKRAESHKKYMISKRNEKRIERIETKLWVKY